MPLIDDATYLAERAYLYDAPVGTTPPTDDQIDEFDSDFPDLLETICPGLIHIGHTDLDEDLKGDEEGGKSKVRGSRQVPNLRVRDEPVTDFFTAQIIQLTEHNQWLYWGGGGVVGGRFVAPTSAKTQERLVLVVFVDGENTLARLHRRCGVKRGGPMEMEAENFLRAPLTFTPLNPIDVGIGSVEWISNELYLAGPKQPTSVAVTAVTSTSVTLGWIAPVGGATSYQVQKRSGPTVAWQDVASNAGGAPTGVTTTVTGLSANTKYDFRVVPVSGTVRGRGSKTVSKTTPAA